MDYLRGILFGHEGRDSVHNDSVLNGGWIMCDVKIKLRLSGGICSVLLSKNVRAYLDSIPGATLLMIDELIEDEYFESINDLESWIVDGMEEMMADKGVYSFCEEEWLIDYASNFRAFDFLEGYQRYKFNYWYRDNVLSKFKKGLASTFYVSILTDDKTGEILNIELGFDESETVVKQSKFVTACTFHNNMNLIVRNNGGEFMSKYIMLPDGNSRIVCYQ